MSTANANEWVTLVYDSKQPLNVWRIRSIAYAVQLLILSDNIRPTGKPSSYFLSYLNRVNILLSEIVVHLYLISVIRDRVSHQFARITEFPFQAAALGWVGRRTFLCHRRNVFMLYFRRRADFARVVRTDIIMYSVCAKHIVWQLRVTHPILW